MHAVLFNRRERVYFIIRICFLFTYFGFKFHHDSLPPAIFCRPFIQRNDESTLTAPDS
ncbi:hypothetical protein K435DRAFT_783586 [Dendrothele bispora CBS 962.96]|uniref:Uncharacterized protein n=1 Tax=Dendrothele bispora (strain CBS 962.96) TaxID=1314807 RepID=A0A4S8L8C2_DENBC|nr:hypothetical protein K435DRAFT_783612 [Dendrothele bispora CBS 962.96]THU84906.1 hypothetical protein K435DRAFT_783586 [Dendrothele bispora CBS 962.96]